MLHYNRIELSEIIDVAKSNVVLFVTIGFLIRGLNFKILAVMVVMFWQSCVLLLKMLIIIVLFITLSKFDAIHFLENSMFDDGMYIQNVY